ncbi:Alkaline phosphatase, tissue-nonspecific isozyme [Halotydeus destructor]|nr:Alkaline phosphatase, tissue-nonspecific isozyme [Halotydeus destructor]
MPRVLVAVAVTVIYVLTVQAASSSSSSSLEEEKKATYWLTEGRKNLLERIRAQREVYGQETADRLNGQKAKNLILFLGDGMGMTTITAGRVYAGERDKLPSPESNYLSFERFPFTSLAKVYNADQLVPDSASTASAILTGVKANYNCAGVSGEVAENDCPKSLEEEARTTTFFQWAQNEGKATGFITNTRVTHATPSAIYAHMPSRSWETEAPSGCKDTASQLVQELPGRDIRLILGGGAERFLPVEEGGVRNDSKNLLNQWLERKRSLVGSRAQLLRTKEDLESAPLDQLDYVMGLFSSNHLMYELDRQVSGDKSEPSLSELVRSALTFMDKYKKQDGYVLFVEGGKIDLSHHQNWAARSLEEVYQLNQAIQVAINLTSVQDTLIVVTADHSHGLTINGYAKRGTPILGNAGLDDTKVNYPTLIYATGPGYVETDARRNVTDQELSEATHSRITAVPLDYEATGGAHGGEDVPVYARGPGAHLFTGVYDQTFIAHLISYVTCTGHHKDMCPSGATLMGASGHLMVTLTLVSILLTRLSWW